MYELEERRKREEWAEEEEVSGESECEEATVRKPLDAEPSRAVDGRKERTNCGRFGLLAVENSRTSDCAVAIAVS